MKQLTTLFFCVLIFSQCQKDPIDTTKYSCRFSVDEKLINHPHSNDFMDVLVQHRKNAIAGGVALVKDKDGLWIGADGYADLASKTNIEICNPLLIASITKMFTATCVLKQTEMNAIDLESKISNYLPAQWIKNISNANIATVKQLLNHTSGIPDFYDNPRFELARINVDNNHFSTREVLAYAEKLDPYFTPGSDYEYSNTNYLLLGLILEQVTGKELSEVYKTTIFNPLGIQSGYYSVNQPFPSDLVTGYGEVNDGELIETKWLYVDEMGTADGGIAINIYDLYLFAEGLFEGDLLLDETKEKMLASITLKEDDSETILGHQRNGLGIEIYDTPFGGEGFGHTGGIDGFLSYLMYFPSSKSFVIYLQNTASHDNDDRIAIIDGLTKLMAK